MSDEPAAPVHEPTEPPGQWERDLVRELATAALTEQRRARRWSIVFKAAFLAYLIFIAILYLPWRQLPSSGDGRHTALVAVEGVIAADTKASAERIIEGLRAAFEDDNTDAVIVHINSPGGSPVQSGYVYDEMRRLRAEHEAVPLYAVITDVCASGGYYIASAADEIYADKASVVGSIGVISNGFGFVDAMDKLGVERRLIAAGDNKGFMDPFSPLKPEEVRHFRAVIGDIHRQFVEAVRAGRGDRLSDREDLYGGLIWTGAQSVDLGLVDGLGSAAYVAREIVGTEAIVDFTPRRDTLERLAERLGMTMADVLVERLGWSASLAR